VGGFTRQLQSATLGRGNSIRIKKKSIPSKSLPELNLLTQKDEKEKIITLCIIILPSQKNKERRSSRKCTQTRWIHIQRASIESHRQTSQ
jgi:hypothetical protein